MQNLQIEEKLTKQVVIEAGLHKELKLMAIRAGMSLKALLEGYIADGLDKDKEQYAA